MLFYLDTSYIYNRQVIEWNTQYIKYLTQEKVTFNKPVWAGDSLESDIIDDLYRIAKSVNNRSERDSKLIYSSDCLILDELHAILQKYGYSHSKSISTKLIEIYEQEIQRLKKEIKKLSQQKIENKSANKLTYMLGMTPAAENTDKVLKYERSLQKSIFQNLLMLKKLQGFF